MCLFTSIGDYFESHAATLQYFSYTIITLNTLLLVIFICELHFLRHVKWCHLPHAFLMVILSMSSSIISSSFFLLSNNMTSICSFGPIIAISFRTVTKTFIWALYIIRGQMVMESLDNMLLSKIGKSAPYILSLQSIFIITLTTIFTETETSNLNNKCSVIYPLWLLICSALIGECIYGLGFLYIFYRAMSITMSNVYKSLSKKIAENTKTQIRHHIRVYIIQLISSLILLFSVSLCICFQTLIFFEFELFISNLCLLLLFRHKQKLCKKVLYKSKYCCCFKEPEKPICISTTTNRIRARSDFSRPVFSNGIISSPKLTSPNSNYFFSNKWRSSKEVIDMQHALKVHTMPQSAKDNKKILELMGVKNTMNDMNKNTNTNTENDIQNAMDITTRFRTFSMDSLAATRDRGIGGSISSFGMNNNTCIPFHIQSMSDPLQPISDISNNDMIDLPNNNPCIGIHHKSQSTNALMNINNMNNKNKNNNNCKELHSQSQHLLKSQIKIEKKNKNKIKKQNFNKINMNNNNNNNKQRKSFMMKFTELIDKFKKTDDICLQMADNIQMNENKKQNNNNSINRLKNLDNIVSLSDPLTSVHHANCNGKKLKKKKHIISSSDDLNKNDEIEIDFI